MHLLASHCRQRHTGLIFLLESALEVLRHASSGLPLPPTAHRAHLLGGERPRGPQACNFRPPTAASGTHGTSSCWRAPSGSSCMHLPPSHCCQRHTGLIVLLESALGVLRHASSGLPLPPAAHRADLLAGERPWGPQACIFWPPTGASGTQGSSSCWRAPSGSSGMHLLASHCRQRHTWLFFLLESALGVLRHASSGLPLLPAAHMAHLLAGERPWGPQACIFWPPTAASGTQGSSSCWRAPSGSSGMHLLASHCRQRHTGLIFLLESAHGVRRHASSGLPLPPAAHMAHLLAGERPRGPQACIFRPPAAASGTHGSSSCWRAPLGFLGMRLPPSHCCQRHTWHIFLLESALGVLRHASSGLPLPPAAHRAHLLAGERPRGPQACIFWPPTAASGTQGSSSCWRAPSGSSGMHLLASRCRQRHTGLIFLLESALGVLRHASSGLPLLPAAHMAHLLAGERPRGPQACIFRPPTAASGTQGSSSCWRAPSGSSRMHLPASHCRQRHTGLIFLLESALGVLRHATSALPLPPAAHMAHLLAGERPRGPQACIFWPPAAASGTPGSSSCWRAPSGSSGMHLLASHCCQRHTGLIFLLESALGVLRHASSGLPLLPAAHMAHLLAGERPRGPQACIFRPPAAASGTHGSSSCWRAPSGSSGMHLLASRCCQRHIWHIFLLESALGVLRHASSGLPLPPAAHMAHLLAGERPRGRHACIFWPPTAASGTQGSSSCWRAPMGSSGMHLLASRCRQRHTGLIFLLESALGVLRHASSGLPLLPAAHRAHLLAGERPRGPQACIFRPPAAASGTQGSSSCWRAPLGSSGMHLLASHCRQRHTGLIFLLESALGVLRHATSALPLPPAAHRAHLLAGERPWGPQACIFWPPAAASGTQGSSSCWRAPSGSSGMHLPPSRCCQRHTWLIFLLESALGVLRHASSALPLLPAAHMAHLLAGERPWGPQACIFWPPTAASGTQGSSSCWRAPSGSSGMHLLASHCRQRHTGLIFLLESALGVLRHASSGLPLPPAAHRAHLLAGERPRGPQACIFWPPTAASGTHGTSSCWRAPSGSSGMHLPPSHCRQRHTGLIFLLESALGVVTHASSGLPLPPAAHRAHLLAGERPRGPQACIFWPPAAASGTQGSSSCWRAPSGSSGMHLLASHCCQRHTGLIFLLESALGVLRHASSGLPLPPAAHRAHLLAGERPRGPQACIFWPPAAASGTQGSSSCWRAPSGSSGMHLLASHCCQRHTGLIFLLESALGVLRHASSGLPLLPAAHMAHLLAGERPRGPQACIFRPPAAASGTHGSSSCWRAPSGSSGMHLLASRCCQRHIWHIFLLESALGVLRHASSGLPLPPAAHMAHLLAGERPRGRHACIFWPPTAASGTQGTSSCWRAPMGSSGMHLLASRCRQRHTGLIFLLESALGVLRHASSGLPLLPVAHRAHLLAGERP